MSRIVIFIITVFFCVTSVVAQNKTTLLQRINEIKSQNELYFWDQYTHPDADTAKIGATKRLLLDVNSNRSEDAQLSVEEVMPHASYINIDRGNLKQYFVDTKKLAKARQKTDNTFTKQNLKNSKRDKKYNKRGTFEEEFSQNKQFKRFSTFDYFDDFYGEDYNKNQYNKNANSKKQKNKHMNKNKTIKNKNLFTNVAERNSTKNKKFHKLKNKSKKR